MTHKNKQTILSILHKRNMKLTTVKDSDDWLLWSNDNPVIRFNWKADAESYIQGFNQWRENSTDSMTRI